MELKTARLTVLVDPAKNVVINELVCEGCGDCGVQSNCVSILPLETPLGRKRQIDHAAETKIRLIERLASDGDPLVRVVAVLVA